MPAAIIIVALAALLNAFSASSATQASSPAPAAAAPAPTAAPNGDSAGGGLLKQSTAGAGVPGQPGTFGH